MKLRGKSILRIFFSISVPAALDSKAGCGTFRFLSVIQFIFLFKKDAVKCDDSCAIISPLSA